MDEAKHLDNLHTMDRPTRIRALKSMIDADTRSLALDLERLLLEAHNAAQDLVAIKPTAHGVAEAARSAHLQLTSLHELVGVANGKAYGNG